MNNYEKKRVAGFMVRHCRFNHPEYELFAKAVLYLVRKYGTSNDYDGEIGEAIQEKDQELLGIGCGYIGGYDISHLLYDSEAGEMTDTQSKNRETIKGAYNA